MTTSAERHAEISEVFMEHAEELLEDGDMLQASEKAWGAVEHCLKSIAQRRNWPSGTHEALSAINDRLALESDDPARIVGLYRTVGRLHSNFYEDNLSETRVETGVRNARELITILKRIAYPA